jgi:citrate synthase
VLHPAERRKTDAGQYDEFKTTVTRHTMIHEQITRLFHAFRRDSHPMAVMCGITGALAAFYHDSLDVNNPRHREIAAVPPAVQNADHGSDVLQIFYRPAVSFIRATTSPTPVTSCA